MSSYINKVTDGSSNVYDIHAADNSIDAAQIMSSAITASAIASGVVVRSVNGFSDAVTITTGTGSGTIAVNGSDVSVGNLGTAAYVSASSLQAKLKSGTNVKSILLNDTLYDLLEYPSQPLVINTGSGGGAGTNPPQINGVDLRYNYSAAQLSVVNYPSSQRTITLVGVPSALTSGSIVTGVTIDGSSYAIQDKYVDIAESSSKAFLLATTQSVNTGSTTAVANTSVYMSSGTLYANAFSGATVTTSSVTASSINVGAITVNTLSASNGITYTDNLSERTGSIIATQNDIATKVPTIVPSIVSSILSSKFVSIHNMYLVSSTSDITNPQNGDIAIIIS